MNENNKNVIKAIVFIFTFLILWETFVTRHYGQPVPVPTTEKVSTPALPLDAALSPSVTVPGVNKDLPQMVTLKNEQAEVVFNTQGARIVQWKIYERDHWLQVFPSHGSKEDAALSSFADLNFSVVSNQNDKVVFVAHHPQGFDIQKTLTLSAEPPFHELSYTFSNPSAKAVDIDAALSWSGGLTHHTVGEPYIEKQESSINGEMRAVGFGNRIMSFRPGMIFGRTVDTVVPGPLTWIGVDNTHFMAALISKQKDITNVAIQGSRSVATEIHVPFQLTLQPIETKTKSFLLYVGPKKYSDLVKLDYHISDAVDFGMFGFIAKGLLAALHSFYGLTGNYGWSIILLTICVQCLVFPLTRKSLKHTARMKELQPQLKVLQEQLKNDPKRLQIETLNLYKKNGMKLMGMEGCFPMLLQMPIFFAFYSTMHAAYDLRGAPWIFWIHDLGAKDPYYILPVLMGIGMFVQQKLTAVAADPAQARIMMFMPVMFTFMFLQLPSGLVLYWFTNSLMSILVQHILTRQMKQQHAQPPFSPSTP